MVLDHDGYLRSCAVLTDGTTADITVAENTSISLA
jgi:hypothetical protein